MRLWRVEACFMDRKIGNTFWMHWIVLAATRELAENTVREKHPSMCDSRTTNVDEVAGYVLAGPS